MQTVQHRSDAHHKALADTMSRSSIKNSPAQTPFRRGEKERSRRQSGWSCWVSRRCKFTQLQIWPDCSSVSTICTRSDLRRKLLRFPNYETGEIGFQLAFPTSPGGKYDQVSLPTLKSRPRPRRRDRDQAFRVRNWSLAKKVKS